MSNWFVNHEGDHLFMEPGERSHLLRDHGTPHIHTDSPVEEVGPRQEKGSFFHNFMAGVKRRLGMKQSVPTKLSRASAVENLRPSSLRPVSVGSEYEMEDGQSRTHRHYAKLANRRSML